MIHSWRDVQITIAIIGLLLWGLWLVGSLTVDGAIVVVAWACSTLLYIAHACEYATPEAVAAAESARASNKSTH